ncbi:hypothetical protein HG536_0H02310 [Torulaspora globosa]|uniref:AB hydrolase-1 domain-containing protein n=1 Tax=Torulaspora globosa TaxID=48254 RepID=A0A7G3ZMX0_9SACH|nr:uncharacterized protein HG536_0H02310 [Torulaspora globosa]QLL34856.1 hypothetical protein HG536_0H02310 [Torulaspora globosa]
MMEGYINSHYKKETKVIDAVYPRSFDDSTLVPGKDVLSIVYDIYTLVKETENHLVPKVNLLFLHGSGMSRCIWEYYVAHIVDHRPNWRINKIVLMDQVTHGDSAVLNAKKLGVNFDWVDGARDACKLAQNEFFGEGSTYNVVIGHSMGGFQALSCGVLMPNLFHLIITIEPVALMYVGKGTKGEYTVISRKLHRALLSKMKDRFQSELEYEAYMRTSSFFAKVHPDILQRIIDFERVALSNGEVRTKMDQRQNILCYMTLFPAAKWLLGSLKFIRSPVVNILGGVSKWTPKENQEVLERFILDYTQDTVPKGDHLLNIENPEETLSKIVCHISRFMASQSTNDLGRDLTVNERRNLFNAEFNRFQAQRVDDRPMELAKF